MEEDAVRIMCNATATFQRLMAQALTNVTKKYGNLIMCYVDDVVIATPTLEDHIERLDEVFTEVTWVTKVPYEVTLRSYARVRGLYDLCCTRGKVPTLRLVLFSFLT